MKNSSSLDRDGIIGRPALFIAFIFLGIAAQSVARRRQPFFSLPFSSFSHFANCLLILLLVIFTVINATYFPIA